MKGLSFFKRQHSNGAPVDSWNIATYHNPNSITWRWTIGYSRKSAGKTGAYFMRVYRYRGFNFHAGMNLPFLGSLTIQTQPHMWRKV